MLRTYSNNVVVSANTAIPFNTNKILTGNTVSHTVGSSNIVITTPGYYKVDFNFSGNMTTAGELIIQLYADGVAIPDAVITVSLSASDNDTGTFNTIIKAIPGSINQESTLTVVPNQNVTLTNVSLGINRLA